MIARIWNTSVAEERAAEYERFALDESLPMFRKQQGFRGVLMVRDGASCQVITLWGSADDVAALAHSASYAETVSRIVGRGFLRGEQEVRVFDVHLAELALHVPEPRG